jgi:hypothetical protein
VLGSFGRWFLLHLICHHLQSEYVEVEGTDMPEMQSMNMSDERPLKRLTEVEGMDTTDVHIVMGKDMAEERPSKRRPEVEVKDMTDKYSLKR